MSKSRKPFAIRVKISAADFYERTYVRPAKMRLSKQAFIAYAVGDLILLVNPGTIYDIEYWEIEPPTD